MLEGGEKDPYLYLDALFSGGVWMLAIPIFERFYPVLKKATPLLLVLYCILMFLFFYVNYNFNRKGNEDNFVLRTGDKFGAKIILSYLPKFNL